MNRFQHIQVPAEGQKITVNADMSLNVPDQPIIPFIEGDGTGVDITPVMIKVVDAAVARAYGGKRKIQWMEVFAGEKSTRIYGPDVWLPEETMQALREYVRSEEHTSELQSQSNLVCRLLLEKKKKKE